ncbi:MAG: ribosome silencing factor [Alistipes sp.]|nr:ribosome silencing factor [Candidatus Minthomonas equi]
MNIIDTIAEAMSEKKGKRIVSLDLRKTASPITDHFVICNADSTPNVNAIADNIEDRLIEKCERKPVRMQGKENGFWVIMDYSDVVVHVFQTEYRNFYRLEDLWADADKKEYREEE